MSESGSIAVAATGITGLTPAQLLAAAGPKPPKVTRRPKNYASFDVDDEIILGQIAGEEREILRYLNPTPLPTLDFAHLDQLRKQAIAQIGIPPGYLK